jgi:AmpD protein
LKLRVDREGLVAGAKHVASPNCDERPAGCAIDLLVIHHISVPPGEFGGPGIEALFLNRLDPAAHPGYAPIAGMRVSAHFLIRRDGELVQFVPCSKGRTRCNDFSIGVELEGTGEVSYTDAQYDRLAALTRALNERYGIADIAGHSDLAPGRKRDPGPSFDWKRYRAMLKRASSRAAPTARARTRRNAPRRKKKRAKR